MIQKLTLLVEEGGFIHFYFFLCQYLLLFIFFLICSTRAPFFYCLFAFVLIFYCLFVFSIYLELMKCNEIAFRWTWYNMNVTTTFNSDSWLGILNWVTWYGWLGWVGLLLACRENDISTKRVKLHHAWVVGKKLIGTWDCEKRTSREKCRQETRPDTHPHQQVELVLPLSKDWRSLAASSYDGIYPPR